MYLPNLCTASDLYLRTRPSVGRLDAFNLTGEEKANVKRKTANGQGTTYTFLDGSVAFIPKGTVIVRVRKFKGGKYL